MKYNLFFLLLSFLIGIGAEAQDMSLKEVIDYAQKNSPNVKRIESNFNSALYNYKSFKASRLPQLNLDASLPGMTRSINSVQQPDGTFKFVPQSQTYSTSSLSFSQTINPLGSRLYIASNLNRFQIINDTSSTSWQAAPLVFGLRQPIFGGNTLRYDNELAEMRYKIAQKQKTEFSEELKLSLTNAYFNLFIVQEELRISQLNETLNDSLYRLSQGRYNVGKISENDLLQVELNWMQAKNNVAISTTRITNAQNELKRLMGYPKDASIDVKPIEQLPQVEIPIDIAVNKAIQNGRAELQRKIQLIRNERDLRNAKMATLPNGFIDAGIGLNQFGGTVDQSYQNLESQQSISFSVSIPIMSWGQNRSQRRALQEQNKALQLDVQIGRQEMEQFVQSEVLNFMQAKSSLVIAAKADTIAQKRYQVSTNRYLIGKIGITDLFIAQKERDGARQNYLQTLQRYWQSYYTVRRLTLYDFELNQDL